MKFEDIELIINELEKLEKHIEILSNYSKNISKIINKAKKDGQANTPYITSLKGFRRSIYTNIKTSKISILKYKEQIKEMYLNDKESEVQTNENNNNAFCITI